MNKIIGLIFASMLYNGCSPSTQVTNNTTNPQGPWVGATQSPQFPLVLGDTTGGTLTAVLDTNAHAVTGAIYLRGDTNEVIFIGDSGLPTRVIVGTKEIIFANYTDTSVDVVATDTAGSIGVQPAVDIRDLLSKVTIHSNKISRTRMKSEVPNSYTLQDFIDEGEIIGTAKDINDCILPIISNLSVIAIPFVGPNPAILLSGWFHPPDFDACQSLFNKIMDALQNSGAFKTTPPAPPIQESFINSDKPWEAANSLDQYISNMGPYYGFSVSASRGAGCSLDTFIYCKNCTFGGISFGSNTSCFGSDICSFSYCGPLQSQTVTVGNFSFTTFGGNGEMCAGWCGGPNGVEFSPTSSVRGAYKQ